MFENTKKALDVFQNAIECAECKKPKKDLQYLGTSCKHAHCWECIADFGKKGPGRRSVAKTMCSTCVFPLDTTKIVGAHVLNTCFDTLTELKDLVEKMQNVPFTPAEFACTQRIFDQFQEPVSGEEKKKAVERFLETQGHMPDEMGQSDDEEEEQVEANRENSVSPELDIFHDYSKDSSSKRGSVKRPSSSSIGEDSHEQGQRAKRVSVLKTAPKKEKPANYELCASQVTSRTHENDMITPFIMRRSTAPTASSSGMVSLYADPFRRKSTEKPEENSENDPFTKKIVLSKRQASLDQRAENQAKDSRKQAVSDSGETASSISTRRHSLISDRRSQSPMSFGERSMSLKPEQRRSSYGTRRGEVVIINSILNNRIPQLKSAVEAGTCVNEMDNGGKTPLYVAVEHNSIEAVKILVEAGAVINASCGSTYETTLHEAVRRKNIEIVEYLLSKGASMRIRNSAGKTAEDLCKNDLKMKKVLENFKTEHILQPVVPPPKSKIHFVQLVDDKMITDSDKRKLPGKINLVGPDMESPTHVVVAVDIKTKVLNISKEHIADVLKAIIKPGMVVSREWLKACIIDPAKVDDDRSYAVKKVQWMDGPVFINRIEEWKKTITKMQPKLFAGCKFYFPRPKYNFLDRASLIEVVRLAGGKGATREPIINEKDPAPYHNQNLKSNFIVYSLTHDIHEKYRDCSKYNLVCEQWLIEAILGCNINTPPY